MTASWQQHELGPEFVSHKRFKVVWSPKIPVEWSVSFQVLNSSYWSGGFISSPWAIAATRVIRQPKSTLGVARQPSGGGRQAGKESWLLVCGLLANQLALLSFFFFSFTWSKEVIARGEEKKISQLPPSSMSHFHVPFWCVTISFQSESAATSAPASCQIMEFSLMPNYEVVSSIHMHMAVVKMSASLSYFMVSFTYIFMCKDKECF